MMLRWEDILLRLYPQDLKRQLHDLGLVITSYCFMWIIHGERKTHFPLARVVQTYRGTLK